jgi:hypothetical protein
MQVLLRRLLNVCILSQSVPARAEAPALPRCRRFRQHGIGPPQAGRSLACIVEALKVQTFSYRSKDAQGTGTGAQDPIPATAFFLKWYRATGTERHPVLTMDSLAKTG